MAKRVRIENLDDQSALKITRENGPGGTETLILNEPKVDMFLQEGERFIIEDHVIAADSPSAVNEAKGSDEGGPVDPELQSAADRL